MFPTSLPSSGSPKVIQGQKFCLKTELGAGSSHFESSTHKVSASSDVRKWGKSRPKNFHYTATWIELSCTWIDFRFVSPESRHHFSFSRKTAQKSLLISTSQSLFQFHFQTFFFLFFNLVQYEYELMRRDPMIATFITRVETPSNEQVSHWYM